MYRPTGSSFEDKVSSYPGFSPLIGLAPLVSGVRMRRCLHAGWCSADTISPRAVLPTSPAFQRFHIKRRKSNFDGWDVINLAALAAQDSCELRDGSRSKRVGHPRWVRARTVFIRDRPGRAVDARDTAISFEALRLNNLQRMPLMRSPGFTRSPRAFIVYNRTLR